MRRLIYLLPILLAACSSKNNIEPSQSKVLYEVISQQSQGGASIEFYEILTEEKEIAMLKNDEALRDKISVSDLKMSSFVILNMGEKPTAGYSISVKEVVEQADKIIVVVDSKSPSPDMMVPQVMTYPFAVVKINSRKPIEIK